MKIAVPAETAQDEPRVAATPETAKKLIAMGFSVSVQAGAGLGSRILDEAYQAAGAKLLKTASSVVKDADIVLRVRRPTPDEAVGYKKGALVIAIMDPFGGAEAFGPIAKAGLTAMAMELMPRITRAQVMDVLSSQANLAGYQAVIEAAEAFDRAFPMMMTAAGTVSPAKAFVMGAGVAGLQAIATARRLGAVVSATDVRPAAKEQVESLGAKFIAVEDDEFRQAETEAGYAKEMSAAYKKKQAELVATHIAKQDIVITTALIPGRPAPELISQEMVESMAPGSVIVDLAVERGGNCALSKPGSVVEHQAVKIIGHLNVAGRIAASASHLYARNLLALVDILVDHEKKKLAVDWNDEIVEAITLTRDGKIVHPLLGAAKAGKAKAGKAKTGKPQIGKPNGTKAKGDNR